METPPPPPHTLECDLNDMLIELGPHLRNFFLVIEGKKMYFINFELHVCQTLSGLKIVAKVQEEDSFYMLQIMIF